MVFRVGLIGLGQIGAHYDKNTDTCMTHLRAIQQSKAFELGFAIDPGFSSAEGNRLVGGVFAQNVGEISDECAKVDLLAVCTPTEFHAQTIKEYVLHTGCKKVLCEKPIAGTPEEVEEISEFCQEHSVDLKVNFMRRSLPSFQAAGKLFETPKSLSRRDIFISYSGDFTNNASHFLDLVLHWCEGAVRIFFARFDKHNNIVCDLEIGDTQVCVRPNPVHRVTDHRIHISTEVARVVFEKAGRVCDRYAVTGDTEFPGLKCYEKQNSVNTGYTRFMSYVYRDVEDWLREGRSENLCSRKQAVYVSEIIEGIRDVASSSH